MKRKFVGLFLVLVILVGCLPNVAWAADYSASRIVNYVNGRIGESYTYGYCLRFVEECYQNIYGFRAWTCCAYKSGSLYIDSTSMDIPLGATVYFGGSSVTCKDCGNKAGHVGIYVGNGYFVHDWDGKVQKTTIDYIVSRGYPYRGWGWMCDTPLTSGDTSPPTNITIKADKTQIAVGGTVNFQYTINNATGKCIGIDWAGGSRYHSITLDNSSGTISYTFTQPGTYCVITEGYNAKGYSCCDGIYISVSDSSDYPFTVTKSGASVSITNNTSSYQNATVIIA